MKYLQGHAPEVLARVQALLDEGRLMSWLQARHPEPHTVRSDRALQAYVAEMKARYLRSAPPLAKVAYDNHLHVVHQALGTHTTVSRVQGSRLQSLFKDAPANFLRMIVVHELAHLREREHGKAFYALCTHMEADYHQLEFETRLWLTALEAPAAPAQPAA
jgi:UTP pyrophosphatase